MGYLEDFQLFLDRIERFLSGVIGFSTVVVSTLAGSRVIRIRISVCYGCGRVLMTAAHHPTPGTAAARYLCSAE